MTFYYSMKSIPELTQLPARMRWRAWFACVHKTLRHWQTWLACGAAQAPILVFFALFIWLAPSSLLALGESGRDFWLPIVLAGLGVVLLSAPGILIFSHIQSEIIRPYLREYLAARSETSDDTIS
jgi:hypothetical protein